MSGNLLWCADMQEGSMEHLYVDAVHYTAVMSERFAQAIAAAMRGDRTGGSCVPAVEIPRKPVSR